MVSSNELSQAKRIVHIIKQLGAVTRWELIDKAKMSISTYNKLKPYILYRWEDEIQYDKVNATWSVLDNVTLSKETLQEELKHD